MTFITKIIKQTRKITLAADKTILLVKKRSVFHHNLLITQCYFTKRY